MRLILFFCLSVFLITGCSANKQSESQKTDENELIRYETTGQIERENKDQRIADGEHSGRHQSKQSELNQGQHTKDYTDIFTNEESVKAMQHLATFKEIKQAQVAASDELVIVSVMLNKHDGQHVVSRIKNEVKQFFPDKKIVVYTDDSHWRHIKNIRSKLKPGINKSQTKTYLNDLFDRDDQ